MKQQLAAENSYTKASTEELEDRRRPILGISNSANDIVSNGSELAFQD